MRKVSLQNIIEKNSEDKLSNYSKKVSSTLPDDSWLEKYKRGGGYFPEYKSFAPPRLKNGGEPEPFDYKRFQKFYETLPNNLKDPNYKYGDYSRYDLYGMWNASGKPNSFTDVKDTELFPLNEDGKYHGFSVGNDGIWLKPKGHKSAWMEYYHGSLNPELKNKTVIQREDGRLQWVDKKQKGGDISIPDLEKDNWLMEYKSLEKFAPGGSAPCPKDHVKIGERCVSIYSKEYKDLYESGKLSQSVVDDKGVTTSFKWDPTKKQWVDQSYLPEVVITAKLTPKQKEKLFQKRMGEMREELSPTRGLNVAESTGVVNPAAKNIGKQIDKKNAWIEERLSNPKIDTYLSPVLDYSGMTRAQLEKQYEFKQMMDERDKQGTQATISPANTSIYDGRGVLKNNWIDQYDESRGTDYRKSQTMKKERQEENAEVLDKQAAYNAINKGTPYTFPTGETKTWDEMTGNEKAYVHGRRAERVLEIFPDNVKTSKFNIGDEFKSTVNWLNPLPLVSGWYSNFAKANYIGEKSGDNLTSYGKAYGKAVLDPALTIAAYAALNPELSAGSLFSKKILNPMTPAEKIAKLATAMETGDLLGFGIKEARSKAIKGTAKELTPESAAIARAEIPTTSESRNIAQNVNRSGFVPKINLPPMLSLVSPIGSLRKYGGSTSWLDKYKI